jgi:GTPase SAR1 family protein
MFPGRLRPGHTSILQVWDIGGQSINSKMVGGYVSGSSVVFVCYDVTDRSSFGDSLDWLRVARQHVAPIDGQNPQVCVECWLPQQA